jgi:hypothetical protein
MSSGRRTTATLSCVSGTVAPFRERRPVRRRIDDNGLEFLAHPPPLALISSIAIVTSLRTVSLIAIVPERECRTPTLIVSAACVGAPSESPAAASVAVIVRCFRKLLRCMVWPRVE